jgi:hypothetical protein
MRQLPTRDEALLELWECGLGHPASARGDALLRAGDDLAAPATLGERTVRLLKLHAALFGRDVALRSRCPACQSIVNFKSDCAGLIAEMPQPAADAVHRLELDGLTIEFRVPSSADLVAASNAPTDESFARRVIDRCVLAAARDGAGVAVQELPDAALDAVSKQMEALDPAAAVSFALACPECEKRWTAPLDVGQLVWQKVQAAAERLLLDVDALARAYGWTEREVLRLSPARRAAYLQIVTA